MEVFFSPRAEYDIRAAVSYYQTIHRTIAERFVEEMESLLRVIEEHPDSFQRVNQNSSIRRAVMHHFPHIIAYDRTDKAIMVLRVRSAKQDIANL